LPFFVRGPGVPANTSLGHATVHVDIAATFLELAGATHSGPALDGKSMVPLLGASPPPPAAWRNFSFTEHFGGAKGQLTWMSVRAPDSGEAMHWWCNMSGDVWKGFGGLAELYSDAQDEYELSNGAFAQPGEKRVKDVLLPLAQAWHECSGKSCHEEPDTPPALKNVPLPCVPTEGKGHPDYMLDF
jgi:hypothetical protein